MCKEEIAMSVVEGSEFCKSCGSINIDKFIGEMGIRRPGLKNVDKPSVLVYSELIVCLNCGKAEFVVPKAELRLLPGRNVTAA
jgi:hypothetical protein